MNQCPNCEVWTKDGHCPLCGENLVEGGGAAWYPYYDPELQKKRTNISRLAILLGALAVFICLAIGFTQWLAEEGKVMPAGLVIISPWLDITLEHPEMDKYAKMDPMLRPDHLKIIGRIWAGTSDPSYYKVSPINGVLEGLPKIYLFVGEREICLPDARDFTEKLEAAGAPYEYYEYPMMNHVFPQYPIREGARARRQIKEILESLI